MKTWQRYVNVKEARGNLKAPRRDLKKFVVFNGGFLKF